MNTEGSKIHETMLRGKKKKLNKHQKSVKTINF